MNYNLEIQKILLRVDKLPSAEDKINELSQAINIADANNDIDWGYDLRDMLIRWEGLLINRSKSFPAFTWMLNAHDNNPSMFDETEILHNYMWMGSIAFCNASVSAKQIEYIKDDFRRRLIKAGFGIRAYYEMILDWCLFTGDVEKARETISLRNKEPKDSFISDNDLLTDICVELLGGNLDKGISMTTEYVTKYGEEHSNTFGAYNQLIYYLNKARDPRAKIYFDKSDAIFSEKEKHPYLIFELTLMMYHMSRNEKDKAWDYFEKYAVWEVDANDYSSFDFSLAVLPLLREKGIKKLILSPKLSYYNPENVYEIENLFDYYYDKACKLAVQFDQRNGNSYFSDQVKWHLEE